jgi:hypothetical protein
MFDTMLASWEDNMSTDHIASAEQIEQKLAEAGVKMTAQHVPTTYEPGSKEWQHIAWRVTLETPRGKMDTDYKQGIGHLPNGGKGYHRIAYENNLVIAAMLKTGKVCRWAESLGRALVRKEALPAPKLADVFSSLILDAGAADYASFEDWADDFGYDADSIKSKGIYDACRDTALQLNRIIGAALIEELRPLAQEL